MPSFSDYLENAVVNHFFRNTATSAPAAVYLQHYTVAPTDAGGGTQVSTGGYTRAAITFGAPSPAGVIANTNEIERTASGASWGEIIAFGVFDAASGGNLLAHGTLPSATIGDGDTIRHVAGALTITLT
jgi:hypothetical protein